MLLKRGTLLRGLGRHKFLLQPLYHDNNNNNNSIHNMAREFKSFSFWLILIIIFFQSFVSTTKARPIINIVDHLRPRNKGFFKGFSLEAVKQSGPSPGEGIKFAEKRTLGGVKNSGPSPGEGH
ncbi:hypothetical protein SLA2020_503760 [Shorea laevis]